MKKFFKNLFQSFASNIITLLFPLVTIPFIIGRLGVLEYGRIVIAQAVVAICLILIEFGSLSLLSSIFSKTHSRKKKLRFFCVSIVLRLVTFFIITLLLIVYVNTFSGDFILFYFIPMLIAEVINPTSICLSLERARLLLIGTVIGRTLSLVLIFTLLSLTNKTEYVAIALSLGLLSTYLFVLLVVFNENYELINKGRFNGSRYYKILSLLAYRSIGFTLLRFTNVLKDKSIIFVISMFLGAAPVAIYDIAAKVVNILNIPIFNFSNYLLIWKRKVPNPEIFVKLMFGGALLVLGVVAAAVMLISDIYKFFEVSISESYVLAVSIFWASIIVTYISSVVGNYYLLGLGRNKSFIWTSYVSTLFLALILSYIILIDGEVSFLKIIFASILTSLFEMILRLYLLRPRWSN